MNKNQVNTAFGILVEEIEKIFDVIRKDIEDAAKLRDFDKLTLLLKRQKTQSFWRKCENALKRMENNF